MYNNDDKNSLVVISPFGVAFCNPLPRVRPLKQKAVLDSTLNSI